MTTHAPSLRATPWLAAIAALLLAACGTPPAPTVTVHGRLVMGPDVPIAGALVHAQGKLVTSDAEGHFVLTGVSTPYTLTVASTAAPAWAHVVEGLASAAPVVAPPVPNAPWLGPGAYLSARISGATPNTNPLPPGQRLELVVEGIDALVLGRARVGAGDAAFDLDALWWTPGDVDVLLHALLLQVDAGDRPIGVLGYGSVPLTLAPNATVAQIAPSGPPPATVDLQGVVAVPGGGALERLAIGLSLDGSSILPLVSGVPGGTSIGFVAPLLASRPLAVSATAGFPAGGGIAWAVVDPSAPFTLEVPAPPQPLAPVDGAEGVTGATAFTLVGDPDRVHEFGWRRVGGGESLSVTLLTRRTSVTLPDLTPVNLAWTPGATYAWTVTEWHDGDADAVAGLPVRDEWLALVALGAVGMDADGWLAGTHPGREVTLAP